MEYVRNMSVCNFISILLIYIFYLILYNRKKNMIPDSYEDNFSNQPSKKVHIIESNAVEDETEWEMYCLKIKFMII